MKISCTKNLFILTTGLSGSSVMTGLVSRTGFWCGDSTEFKDNSTGHYETYENSVFVGLNNQLVELLDYSFDEKSWYDDNLRTKFTELYHKLDLSEYEEFVRVCEKNKVWVLKDPKLWVTIGFWLSVFNKQDIQVIILTRNINSLWLSQTKKKIIYDYSYLKKSEIRAKTLLTNYLKSQKIPYLVQEYESLIQNTSSSLDQINKFLGTKISSDDWNFIYKKTPENNFLFKNELKAILIYLKNFTTRIK